MNIYHVQFKVGEAIKDIVSRAKYTAFLKTSGP